MRTEAGELLVDIGFVGEHSHFGEQPALVDGDVFKIALHLFGETAFVLFGDKRGAFGYGGDAALSRVEAGETGPRKHFEH